MAQQKQLLGHVKGDKGDPGINGTNGKDGKDANIASATGTVTPGHLDDPTVTIEMGGEPGAQTMAFNFAGIQGATGPAGPAGPVGPAGKDGENATTTALSSQDAPGLLRQLSGKDDEVLLGTGEWGAYEGGGGTAVTISTDTPPSVANDGDIDVNKNTGLVSLRSGGKWTESFYISVFKPIENIADASWADIAATSKLAAVAPEKYTSFLGQTKTIALAGISGVTNVTVKIIGIGQDVEPGGAKLGFTFQLTDGLVYTNFKMNDSDTTSGGWRDSKMRSTYLPTVEAALPSDLRNLLKTMVKKTHITDSFNNLIETQDRLALLSQTEVFGDETNPQSSWGWPKGEGVWYQWYQQHNTNNDRIIKRADGSAYGWWLRSVYSSTCFRLVYSNGTLGYNSASTQYLPCACFSV